MRSNGKSVDAELIIQKSLIAEKLDIKDKNLLFMILELYAFVVSCFVINLITKNMGLF